MRRASRLAQSIAVAGLALASLAGPGCAPDEPDDRVAAPPDETYLIVDADAGPAGEEDRSGAVFLWNRTRDSLRLFAADPRLVDPQRVVRLEDGGLLLLDLAATTPSGHGAVFPVDEETGAVGEPIHHPSFDRPVGLTVGADGTVYVTDRSALPEGDARGAVFALDPRGGAVRVVARDPRFRAPAFLLALRDGTLVLLDADARTGDGRDEGVLFSLDPASGDVRELARLSGAVSPLGLLEDEDGSLLVFDANADPRGIGGPLGAVFRLGRGGETSLVVSDHPMRDPVRGCRAGDGLVLFVDANADPEGRGPDRAGRGQNATGGGAVLALDAAEGTLRVLAAPVEFVNPVDILRWP